MIEVQKKIELNPAGIDQAADIVERLGLSLKMDRKETIRLRLMVEEILTIWKQKFGSNAEFSMQCGNRLGHPFLRLGVADERVCNPLKHEDNDFFMHSIMRSVQVLPDFYYRQGCNYIQFRLKRPQMNQLQRLLCVILFALVIGFLGKLALPAAFLVGLTDYVILPTYEKFLDVLSCIASPLIFLSVAWGIYGIGDVATLSKLGKGLILRFLRNVSLASLGAMLLLPVMGVVIEGGTTDIGNIMGIYQMFLDMLPTTIIEPFATGNTIQVIVLAVVMGFVLLYLGARSHAIATAIEQLNYIVTFIMEIISKLVPFFIVIVLVNLIWSDKTAAIMGAWKLLLCLTAALLISAAVFVLVTSINQGVNPLLLVRKSIPSCLIALSTASSAAAFGTLVSSCREKFGIQGSLSNFGVPLGIVMQKISLGVNNMLVILFVAGVSGRSFSVSWLVLAVIVAIVTALATPPVPGGATIAYTMIFTQLNLPMEYLSIILALDVLTDFITTATDIFCLPFTLTNIALRFGLLDKKILKQQ